jgi:cysteine desulfurase
MELSKTFEKSVYLDYNATCPLRTEVKEAILDTLNEPANPSSVHSSGRRARAKIEKSRIQVANLVGSKPENIIFTSGATEADILAIKGTQHTEVIISSIEHDAVLSAVPEAKKVPVDANGLICLEALGRILSESKQPSLVSIMWANNETGVIQPIKEIVKIASFYGAIVHADAVQALGKVPVDFNKSDLDMMSISGHKIGGVSGSGALIIKDEIKLQPLMVGGGQERGQRSGTENIIGIVGFGAAAEALSINNGEQNEIRRLRDLFEIKLLEQVPSVEILCKNVPRLGNTSAVVMPGVSAETQVMAFDLEGIYISAGAACSSGKVKQSHVIKAMGIGGEALTNTIRVSFGWQNKESDVGRLVDAWLKLYKRANN